MNSPSVNSYLRTDWIDTFEFQMFLSQNLISERNNAADSKSFIEQEKKKIMQMRNKQVNLSGQDVRYQKILSDW